MRIRVAALSCLLNSAALWAGSDFEQGLQLEKQIQIYQARASFQKALAADPSVPGVAEHTAWFLFLNGFHDEECLTLIRKAAPKS